MAAWPSTSCDPEAVDLVLTDLQMPVMDGAELCRQLRASAHWQHLPVYVITADLSGRRRSGSPSAAARGHLDKPVLLKELAILLHRLRSQRR